MAAFIAKVRPKGVSSIASTMLHTCSSVFARAAESALLMFAFSMRIRLLLQEKMRLKYSISGKTLHCLMDLMRPNPKKGKARQQDISEGCRGEMSKLMKEADVGKETPR